MLSKMKSLFPRLFLTFFLISFLQAAFFPASLAQGESTPAAEKKALDQLANMSAEEKVGQLFLVTFAGPNGDPDSEIYNLVANYHIGGVILKRDNDNFRSASSLPEDCRILANELQLAEYNSSQANDSSENPLVDQTEPSSFIPLFIGLSHEGDQSDYTEIFAGLSPLPSQLSIGATWDAALAQETGETAGKELSNLGVNLLLGPSLDVYVDPAPGQSDLGVRSFGGDPYWVGKMGQAYIRGVHQGSNNKLAVIGKYFPGLGSADRLPEEEIATVRKSLEQLQQIDLAPFFAVTGEAPDASATVDGLLNSHIRYQGLQGNIRSTTRPISLDPQAFNLLMGLDPFDKWRASGGMVISDNLGSQALRQLYDPTGSAFNIRQVALDAIIAGNDILYLGDTGMDQNPILSSDIAAALDFFAQKYKEDETFASRVDESVTRILALKYSLYPDFDISAVSTQFSIPETLGESDIASIVARNSATLINPEISELDSILPEPPSTNDRLVIITDVLTQQACSECPELPTLGKTDLENAVLGLYGPLSGGQLVRANLTSYSYKEVITLLDFPSDMGHLEKDLFNADWILVAALDLSDSRPTSQALHRLLSERQDLLREKKIVVFAFGAPFYLDATNISKISAFYGLYNQLPSSVEIAARLLFKEIPSPRGRLPVSVPGIAYDLISATSPDPDRPFNIFVSNISDPEIPQTAQTETPTVPVFNTTEVLEIQTGVILDHNGNPVPDGTPVDFVITAQGVETFLPEVTTVDGSASSTYLIDRAVNFTVQAISASARSNIIQINVIGSEDGVGIASTSTPPPGGFSTPSQTLPTTETPTPASPGNGSDSSNTIWRYWLLSILATGTVAMIAYQVGASFGLVRWGIRWSFSAMIGGLFLYNYLMFNLPGSAWILDRESLLLSWGASSAVGALLGWIASYLIQRIHAVRTSASKSQSR